MSASGILIVVFRSIADNSDSSGWRQITYSDADASATRTLHEIVCNTNVAAPQTDAYDIYDGIWGDVADIRIDFAMIGRREVSDTADCKAVVGRGHAIVIQHVMVNCEVAPEGQVEQIIDVRVRRRDEIVMDMRASRAQDTSTQRDGEAVKIIDGVLPNFYLPPTRNGSKESKLLRVIRIVSDDSEA